MSKQILTYDERKLIEKYFSDGLNKNQISQKLNRHRSTIGRELKRNGYYQCHYIADWAHLKWANRKSEKRVRPVTENEKLKKQIKKYLKIGLSPDVMIGRAKIEKIDFKVSIESIYKIVWRDYLQGGHLYKYLTCNRKRRKRQLRRPDNRGKIKDFRCISERPGVVNERTRLGHWEGDTIIGANHKGVFLTLIDRKSRDSFAVKLKNKTARSVTKAMKNLSDKYNVRFKTITFDRGLEFAGHKEIERLLKAKVYFAHPHSPWEKGAIENYNRILRRFFPKGTNLTKIKQISIDKVVKRINNTPRKVLNYKTPYEIYNNLFVAMLN